jgi:hypothetical protein
VKLKIEAKNAIRDEAKTFIIMIIIEYLYLMKHF